MTTGLSTTPLSERLAERRKRQLDELDELTQRELKEHERDLKRLLSDARTTTVSAINSQNERLSASLNEAEQRQQQQAKQIEQRLAMAVVQAERLSRVGGIRSWTRPAAITLAVMLTISALVGSGILLTDRLIESRLVRLETLNTEIERAEALPRLPQGVAVRTLNDGHTYLTGIDSKTAWVGTLNDDTPVIRLTTE